MDYNCVSWCGGMVCRNHSSTTVNPVLLAIGWVIIRLYSGVVHIFTHTLSKCLTPTVSQPKKTYKYKIYMESYNA